MGYLFITLKNTIARILNDKKTIAGKARKLSLDIDDLELGDNDCSEVELDFTGISPFNKAIFRWHLKGWTFKYLSDVTKMPEPTLSRRIHKLERYFLNMKMSKLELKWFAK